MRSSDWSSDVCSSDLCYDIGEPIGFAVIVERPEVLEAVDLRLVLGPGRVQALMRFGEIPPCTRLGLLTGDRILRRAGADRRAIGARSGDRKSPRLNSSH